MKILAIGDIVGGIAIDYLEKNLSRFVNENKVDFVIANAEKAPIEDQSLKSYNPDDALPYPKWEIYIDNGGKFRFRLNASNGSCVCHSQGYTTKAACKNGIDSIIRSSKNAEIDKTYINKEDK